jgi:hypothetical protein
MHVLLCDCSRFEKILLENDGGAGWAIGSGVTYADFVIFYWVDYVSTL